jgi:hypothetical protein
MASLLETARETRLALERFAHEAERHRINAFFNGMADGIRMFAHWKDGTEYVGSCDTPLKSELSRVEAERASALLAIDISERMREGA